MAIASKLPQLFLALRRLLQLLKPSSIPRALRRILGRLALIWSILRNKLGFRQQRIAKPPPSSQDDNPRKTEARQDTRTVTQPEHTEEAEISRLKPESIPLTLTEQGEIISLNDIALSAFPFPGNIRATRSTHSLVNSHRSHPSVHNLAITRANNASRSSHRLGSDHSHHSGNSNYSSSITNIATHLNQPSRDFPAWQQLTVPSPHREDTPPNVEVISPKEEAYPTGIAEMDSLHIPTRSATPAFKALDDPRILPKMPETFANRRYDGRPRM